MKRRKRFIRIRETLQSFDSLYSEINEYNTTFWSKILFSFWTLLGTLKCFLFYVFFRKTWFIINKFILFYAVCLYGCQYFLFIIFTTSSVTYCANKSYKTLNSLIISYSKHNKHRYYRRISIKIKGIFLLFFFNWTYFLLFLFWSSSLFSSRELVWKEWGFRVGSYSQLITFRCYEVSKSV